MKLYLTLAMCAVPVLSPCFKFPGKSSATSTVSAQSKSCSSNLVPMAAGGAVLLCVIAYAIYAYWNGNWPFTKAEEKKVDLKDLLALNDKEVTEADYTKFKDLLESTDATNVADSNKDKFDKIKAALEAKAPQA